MFSRIRVAFGIALALAVLSCTIALAKGNYSFITIAGSSLKETIYVKDSALMTDFFAFAVFYQDETQAPADAGTGYEITRFYMDGSTALPFDRLHYYPETGLVYYDGIAGDGSSEYDGKWYLARPEVRAPFENALSSQSHSATADSFLQSMTSLVQSQSTTLVAILVALVVVLLSTFRFRRMSTR